MARWARWICGIISQVHQHDPCQCTLIFLQADEAGVEKQKPTFEESAADGIVAIIAASDTVASTMCSLVWFLLSNPEYYRRVQQELDSVFVDGDDPFEVSKHQELHFLSACMSVDSLSHYLFSS
jgi:cytochrome P450